MEKTDQQLLNEARDNLTELWKRGVFQAYEIHYLKNATHIIIQTPDDLWDNLTKI